LLYSLVSLLRKHSYILNAHKLCTNNWHIRASIILDFDFIGKSNKFYMRETLSNGNPGLIILEKLYRTILRRFKKKIFLAGLKFYIYNVRNQS